MVYDYVIVGGGLSGIYHAYQFHKKHPKASIHVLQDSKRLGGRIYTHTLTNGIKVDMGAGRIAKHHPKTMALLKELGLDTDKDLIPLTNIPTSLKPLSCFESEKDALLFLVRIAKTVRHRIPKKYQVSMTFEKVCRIFFNKKMKQLKEAIYVCGYDTEFSTGSAWVMCRIIQDIYDPSLSFASIQGGLGRIIDELLARLKKAKKVVFHTECPVLGWRKPETKAWEVMYRDGESIKQLKTRHLHIATPVSAWEKWLSKDTIRNIPVNIQDYISNIKKISLCRVYATYGDSKWVSAIDKCVTTSPLRYIIPIQESTVMISYLDGEKADELAEMDEATLKDWVIQGTRETFPGFSRFIPEPQEIKRGYWNVGVHIWAPMRRSVPSTWKSDDPSFSFSGEAFSEFHQAWMEGALATHTEN